MKRKTKILAHFLNNPPEDSRNADETYLVAGGAGVVALCDEGCDARQREPVILRSPATCQGFNVEEVTPCG